jgi:mono/diheme cytochrome c family protein
MVLTRFLLFLFVLCLGSCGTGNASKNEEALPSETPSEKGASLYTVNCASCHGEDGKLGASGAKDLTLSKLSDIQIKTILKKGKNAMPPMADILENNENIDVVIQHIKSLRK